MTRPQRSAAAQSGEHVHHSLRPLIRATLSALLVFSVVIPPPPEASAADLMVTETRVGASSHDAEESDSGNVSLTSSDLEMTLESTTQTVGIRFENLMVPQGAVVSIAWVQFQADEINSEATNLTIRGESVDDASIFSSVSDNITSRSVTSAAVAWSPLPWLVKGEAGVDQTTPNLAMVVQEVVDRQGWSSGNALALVIGGTGKRVAESYDGLSAAAPLLHVEYSVGVSVEAIDALAVEGSVPADEGVFRFTRSGSNDQSLTVTYLVAGSATPGVDFGALSGTVTIPTGSPWADVTVSPIDDGVVEGTESIEVTVVDGADYLAGSTASATVLLVDDDTPTVSVTATDTVAIEGASPPNQAEFTITRTGPTDALVTVDYTLGGDATSGADYVALPGSVTILTGQSSASVPIVTLDDLGSEQNETITLTVIDGAGYATGPPQSASVTIVDNDQVLDIRVATSSDDAEEDLQGGVSRTSGNLDLGDPIVGIRFTSVGIQPGATITAAWVQFQVDDVSIDPSTLLIEGQAVDDAPSFSNAAFDISSRSRTTVAVAWSPPGWDTTRAAGPDQQTPDLTEVVQEIIDDPGWVAGNSLAFIITGSGPRIAEPYDGDPSAAAVLHIEHSGNGTPSNQPPAVAVSVDSVVFPESATLDGTVSDDLLPASPAMLAVQWAQVSGPGTVTFADPSAVDTTATFSAPGVYELELSVTDGALETVDRVLVSSVDPNQGVAEVIRFAAFGDYGKGCCGEASVASLVSSNNPDFVITLGDNRYVNDIDLAVGQFYSEYIANYQGQYGQGSALNRFFPAIGNHDYSEFGGIDPYLDYFSLPGGAISTSGTSGNNRYYDFIQGPVHFFVLNSDSNEPDGRSSTSAQAQWLEAQLAASTTPWQIVYFHHAPYSSGIAHGPQVELQWPFEAWGADAVLAGHDHNYERLSKGGVPYFVVGTGGAGLREQALIADPDSQFFYNADHGALVVNACADRLSFEFHSVSGGLVDSYAIGGATCSAVNQPPVANDDSPSTSEGVAVTVDVAFNDTDPDGDLDPTTTNTACVGCSTPADGSLTNNGDGTFLYTPDVGFNGSDSFVYEICDTTTPTALCDTATVDITVTVTNDPPVANDDSPSTSEDVGVTIDVAANDTDPDANLDPTTTNTACVGCSTPSDGSLTNNGDGTFDYTPNQDFNGPDAFVYEICDTLGLCDTATVSITVNAVDDPPVANDDSPSTSEEVAVLVDVAFNDTDPDGNLDPASANTACVGCSTPTDGSLTNNGDGTFDYTPDVGFNGPDSFIYEICDLTALCDTATVDITVTVTNDPPVANDDSPSTAEDVGVTVDVAFNDTDPDENLNPMTTNTACVGCSTPADGLLTNNGDGTFDYTPDPDFNGLDSFVYEICDTLGLCDAATVSITVDPVADPPVANGDSPSTSEGVAVLVDVAANDTDPDGDLDPTTANTACVGCSTPADGLVTNNGDGTFLYTPDVGFNGSDSFVYEICDLTRSHPVV